MFKNFITKTNLSKSIFNKNTLFLNNKNLFNGLFKANFSSDSNYEFIKTETPFERVGLITLFRPKAKNALSNKMVLELNTALKNFEEDDNIASIVLSGHQDYFAAGADIKEMNELTFSDCYKNRLLEDRDYLAKTKKPVIGCVNGFALGGGCEIALMCDILVAGSNALFGQPEITIGTVPGMGGSQRLARVIGKSRTMEMVLTGEPMKAEEALLRGLVSKVVDKEKSLEEALNIAKKIASKSILLSMANKDLVNAAYETTLSQGIAYEKRVFWSTFATQDRKLGMGNFVNKVKDYKFTDK